MNPMDFEHEPCGETYIDNTAELPVNGHWSDQTCNETTAQLVHCPTRLALWLFWVTSYCYSTLQYK